MAGTSRTAPEDRRGNGSRDGRPDPATEAFLAYRNLLFTVAQKVMLSRRACSLPTMRCFLEAGSPPEGGA